MNVQFRRTRGVKKKEGMVSFFDPKLTLPSLNYSGAERCQSSLTATNISVATVKLRPGEYEYRNDYEVLPQRQP
jgi:hypothetical protein